VAKKATKETTKKVAEKTASDMIKVVGEEVVKKGLISSVVGIAKSPHVRSAHTRKLASWHHIEQKYIF